jgi:hypothetical protein
MAVMPVMGDRLIAFVLVAALRRYVAEEPGFLPDAFGDDVYELMAALTTIATDDPDADRRYWNSFYEEDEVCLQ